MVNPGACFKIMYGAAKNTWAKPPTKPGDVGKATKQPASSRHL